MAKNPSTPHSDHFEKARGPQGTMPKYLLQMTNRERLALQRALKSNSVHERDQEAIDALRIDLNEMSPHLGIVIEVPEGITPDDLSITTSLQMPLDVYITQRDGNHLNHCIKEPVRDPDRVRAIVSAIGVNGAVKPLLVHLELLRTCLVDACENRAPDLMLLQDTLDDFAIRLKETRQKIHALNP